MKIIFPDKNDTFSWISCVIGFMGAVVGLTVLAKELIKMVL